MFWVISVYFNIRNTLPKSGTFVLGHPVHHVTIVVKCGGKTGQEFNKANDSVLEGTVEKQWNSITVKSILFLLEVKIENTKYTGCKRTF